LNGLSLNFNQFGFLIILFFLRNNYFNQNIIKKIILKTGIISFLILSIAKIYFKNNYFIVDSFMGSTRYFYSIQLISIPLISWTSFILFFDYIEKNKIKDLMISLLFFLFPIFFNNARGYLISLLLLFLFIFFKKKYFLNIKFLVFIFILLFFLFYTNIISTKLLLFEEIFYSYKYLNNNNDQSSLFRFFEVRDVLIYIAKYPFFGVGSLNDIITKIHISKYLYPSDIGILGILYNFGFIGLLIYSYQIIILRKIYNTKIYISSNFSKATFYYLIFFIIESLFTGNFVYKISYFTLLTSIILFTNFEYNKEKI